ncbi:MAG: HEPN domain-containing protein [Phormidesmis sp. CAN_BIN44]|nr:HEPN domain-containing protein [Phormidesmis sp. CAN_BIN44]
MRNLRDLALGWFGKADSDLTTAQVMLGSAGPYDTACFHAQQAAEKYLKGFLALNGEVIPRIHDLIELNRFCAVLSSNWQVDEQALAELMPFAVEARYDLGFFPDRETAATAVVLAEQVRNCVLAAVGEAP